MSSFHAQEPTVANTDTSTATIRRGSKAVVAASSGVLLVKERHDDGTTFWTLPGGGVRPGESLVDGLQRELREELRCSSIVGDAVSEFWYAHRSSPDTVTRYTVFQCALLTAVDPVSDEGILDARWVDADSLPPRALPQVCSLLGSGETRSTVPVDYGKSCQ